MPRRALESVLFQTLRRNRLTDALLYLQITRGTAPRNHLFPKRAASLVVTVRRPVFPGEREREEGVGVITRPDLRWGRCDIKSISLLPNVMARQSAAAAGCPRSLADRSRGHGDRGSASNAYIVDAAGRLITPSAERAHPRRRDPIGDLGIGARDGIEVVERPFSLDEAHGAREAALSSTSSWLLPVTAIDGRPVSNGMPGHVVRRLMALYGGHLAVV